MNLHLHVYYIILFWKQNRHVSDVVVFISDWLDALNFRRGGPASIWKSCPPLKTQPVRRSAWGENNLIQRGWKRRNTGKGNIETEWEIYREAQQRRDALRLDPYLQSSESRCSENNLSFAAVRPVNYAFEGEPTFTHGSFEMRDVTYEETAALLNNLIAILRRELGIWSSLSEALTGKWTHRALWHMSIFFYYTFGDIFGFAAVAFWDCLLYRRLI